MSEKLEKRLTELRTDIAIAAIFLFGSIISTMAYLIVEPAPVILYIALTDAFVALILLVTELLNDPA